MNPTVKLELSQEELQALAGLIDAGVKAMGLQAARPAAVLLGKMEEAVAAANAAQEAPAPAPDNKEGE